MIDFYCPRCRELLSSPERLAGKRVKCPACGHGAPVPETSQGGPGEALSSLRGARAFGSGASRRVGPGLLFLAGVALVAIGLLALFVGLTGRDLVGRLAAVGLLLGGGLMMVMGELSSRVRRLERRQEQWFRYVSELTRRQGEINKAMAVSEHDAGEQGQ
jgi:hypothetical protein